MRDVIRVMDVSKSFGEETVLHHISYDFKAGFTALWATTAAARPC